MKKELARQMIDAMKKLDGVLNELTILSQKIEDDSERAAIMRGLATLMHESHLGITLPIARQYPEMHRDNVEGGWTYRPGASSSRDGR